jgi:hypothetical protein
MSQQPPTRAMRENPDLDQLKRQAKELLEDYLASSPRAVAEVAAYHRTAARETFALHDAQFVQPRSYGFESWPKLKAAVDGVTASRLHEAAESGAVQTARELLVRRPEIVDLGRGEMRALHMAVRIGMRRARTSSPGTAAATKSSTSSTRPAGSVARAAPQARPTPHASCTGPIRAATRRA